jgi:hypothetical protein
MTRGPIRRIVIFGGPALLGLVNLAHPVLRPPMYPAVLAHLPWWVRLHLLNLALFPLFGLAAWLLLEDVRNAAATVSRVALALFVPLYSGFDAAIGIGTGVLVEKASRMSESRIAAAAPRWSPSSCSVSPAGPVPGSSSRAGA